MEQYITTSLEMHLFFGRIMKEHALFIRGLLDPTECELVETADTFAGDHCRLLEEANHYLRLLEQERQKVKTAIGI